ncbi:MAG: GntR family transcriptional regulator [Dehalococcoidia bacterium]
MKTNLYEQAGRCVTEKKRQGCRSLDQNSEAPLFHQLLSILRDEILGGAYHPHDRLPSEQELCRRHGVSRATVRMALDKLEEQRLIYRRQGKGTFVRPPEPRLSLSTDPSFARELRLRGVEPGLRTLVIGRRRMPAAVAVHFPDTDGAAFYVERLILGDGAPWGIARMCFHPAYGLSSEHFQAGSLMIDVLHDARRVRIVDAFYLYLEPVVLTDREAELLDVRPGAIGLDVARLLIDQHGRVAVHARTTFRADRCRLLFSSRETAAAEPAVAAD